LQSLNQQNISVEWCLQEVLAFEIRDSTMFVSQLCLQSCKVFVCIVFEVNGSVAEEWALNNAKYYRNVSHPIYVPEMNVGTRSFRDLIDRYSNIELITRVGWIIPQSVKRNGTRIVEFQTKNDSRMWQASVFIDASYEGDLVRYAGLSFTSGRESQSQYEESYAGVRPYESFANFLPSYPVNATFANGSLVPYVLPENTIGPVGSQDQHLMTFTYRLCVTTNRSKQAPFPKPNNYDPIDFILLQRYIDSLIASGKSPQLNSLFDVYPYSDRGCPITDIYDLNGSFNSAFTTDPVNLNEGFVNGTDEDRRRIASQTADYVYGYLWYLLTSPQVPQLIKDELNRYGLCNDQWPETHHRTPQLYIREGLRLINDDMFTQHDVVSGLCRNDSIALGSWKHDVHVVTRIVNGTKAINEGQMFYEIQKLNGSKSGVTFEIPSRILLPKRSEATNLIVSVCHAASHVAYATTRLEPTFMLLGGAAGYLASFSILNDHADVQSIDIRQVQQALHRDGVMIHYPREHCH